MSSSSSSSSSSSGCCSMLYCGGLDCSHFIYWNITGLNKNNSDNCSLYVLIDIIGNYQQISIYKDSSLSNMVANGQRIVFLGAGYISLSERNGSGLSGNVSWDGTPTFYSYVNISCQEDVIGSSSSSSISSISDSSISSFSTSSSSSLCCVNLFCMGADCSHFSNWSFNGNTKNNTNDCSMYVEFDFISSQQQIRIYSDQSMAAQYLVASGQGNTGVISLLQRNSSGLSGSVIWDGTPIYYPSNAILDCDFSSSSSESSFSSESLSSLSTSSISSHSTSSSNSSSRSSNSSNSSSNSSSSSSSSMDSNSSSSESIGNVSTSSSSSFVGWNKIKPLILGMSAINAQGVINKMAQTISLVGDYYDIGKVFCYFYGPYGTSSSYTIHLDIYKCNDNGDPSEIIESKSISGVSINGNGWYSFDVNISGETPTNKYLSFVVWQENGDENNYSLWGYYYATTTTGTKALFSNDGINWQYQEGAIRSLKLIGNFDAYDLNEFRIVTPPAEKECIVGSLSGGVCDGTKLVAEEYQYTSNKVIIDNPSLISSFVIDSSGSMGWNDRFSNRQEFVNNFIQKVKQYYPNNAVFDIVKFGSQIANVNSITSNIGFPATINVNLSLPTRTTYSFVVSNANAVSGDIYSSNNYSFSVLDTVSSSNVLTCYGDGVSIPFNSGTLVRTSGSGDVSIDYSSYTVASISDNIVAYGFKDLEEDHSCNLSEVILSGVSYDVSLINWQPLTSGGEVILSMGTNGPNNSSSIDFISSSNLVLRRVINSYQLITTKISSNASIGSYTIYLDDTSDFSVGDIVDFVDKKFASLGHTISVVTSSSVTIQTPLLFDISSWNNDGGIMQQSNINNSVLLRDISANIQFRDIFSAKSITLFLQTVNGLSIEWDINPFKQWYINNLYWLDETALLPISVFDVDGNPFPDGTEVVFYVGGYPSDSSTSLEIPSQNITINATIGSSKIYVNTQSYSRNQSIDVLNNLGNNQTVTITSIGSDSNGSYIQVTPVLQYNFNVSDGSKIIPSITAVDTANASSEISQTTLLSSGLSLVDVTPIYTGQSLDPSLIAPYDPPPTEPTMTYAQLNLDQERIRNNITDMPSIDGYSVIRILPITEDNLKTTVEKNQESSRLLSAQPSAEFTSQVEQNQGDISQASSDIQNAIGNITTTTTTLPLSQGLDYNIDNPVYLIGGSATSSMTTFATQFEEVDFNGINVPEVDPSIAKKLLVKKYEIYPAVIAKTGNIAIAKQYFTPFQIYFTPPVAIYSKYIGGTISSVVEKSIDPDCPDIFPGYSTITSNGVYASDNGFVIKYIVSEKNSPPNTGTLTIRIYSNTIVDISTVLQQGTAVSRQDLNVILPQTSSNVNGQIVVTQPLTDISLWRNEVENNPASQVIQDASVNSVNDVQNSVVSQAKYSLQSAGYVLPNSSATSSNAFEYYTNPWEWTKATQFGNIQETTIDIINGEATLTIPSSDISSLLMIQASIYYGNNNQFESIRSDVIPIANPIDISGISPTQILAQGSDITYSIGSFITWNGQPIADNVIVSYSSVTPSLPSVSKTDDGWAGGVYLGPHPIVTMTCPTDISSDCACHGQYESIQITVSYLGYTRVVSRTIEWTGQIPEPSDLDNDDKFYFYVDAVNTSTYADGFSTSTLTIDLNNTLNDIWIESQYPSDGKNRERMKGYEQGDNQLPNKIAVITGLNHTQSQTSWINDVSYINIGGLNQNIGHAKQLFSDNPFDENLPWAQDITIATRYQYYDQNNKLATRLGTGVVQYPYTSADPITGNETLIVPYPQINFIEPLGISLSIETYNGEFIRNGIESANIVADVTWEGQIINGYFTKNKGQLDETIIQFPFPTVTFEAGICSRANGEMDTTNNELIAIDDRNIPSGCLVVGNHPDVSLNSYSAVVSLSRTDIYNSGSGTHTHVCSVDLNGNGITSDTIMLSGESIENHVHTIENYVALSSGIISHQHLLRSVAIVQLNPLVNPNVNIAINGYVVYDPTNCKPYSGTDTTMPTVFANGNRMMFATLYVNSKILNRELILSLNSVGGYTSETDTDTSKGINVVLQAKISQYSIEDYPGHWIIIPESPVPDGTRIIWNIDCFKPISASQASDVLIMRPDAVRKYMYINAKATVYFDDLQASVESVITVLSNLQWIPSVDGLVIEPTSDDIYLSSAISKINSIGASQIHDAVTMASQRIIQFQTDNPTWKSAKKVVFLLTDGDENSSENSIEQAINNIGFIDGEYEVPVIPVRLGYSYGSDDIILNKYSSQTGGSLFYMINSTDQDISTIMNNIITSAMGVNYGTYTNTIDLLKDNLFSSASFDNILLPTNSRALFRVRFSSDNIAWSTWSEWYDTSITKDFSLDLSFKGRYFQYQVSLYGNENFESPEILAGVNLCYYVVQSFTVFFQPIDLDINMDEYLASIHITHKATTPSTSFINYGYAQFNTTDITDYYSVTRPWITPDRHTIILTRYNELLLTSNYQKYTAINGGWPEGAQVEVYRVNSSNITGALVSSTEYAMNNKTGGITFYNSQSKNDSFVICVYFDPVFRLICNVVNYGPDPAVIDHIGVLYNIAKRIPTSQDGIIIHTPIKDRI